MFTDKLDHFNLIELELNTEDDIADFIEKIEAVSEKYDIEIKQIKDISEDDDKYNSLKIVCKYNNKMLNNNKVISKFASIQNLKNISESSN